MPDVEPDTMTVVLGTWDEDGVWSILARFERGHPCATVWTPATRRG